MNAYKSARARQDADAANENIAGALLQIALDEIRSLDFTSPQAQEIRRALERAYLAGKASR